MERREYAKKSCCQAVGTEMLMLDVLFDETEARLYIFSLNNPDLHCPRPYFTNRYGTGSKFR